MEQVKYDLSDDKLVNKSILPIKSGSRIGLFGGTFNPAHEWHQEVSKNALKELKLDLIIWLVSASNPLKEEKDNFNFQDRYASAREIAQSKDFFVSDFEIKFQTKYSIDTVTKIRELHPDVNFVWIMGSDCAAEINKWKNWEQFLDLIPVAIYPRPEYEIESKKLNIIKERANQIDLKQNYEFATFKPPIITFIPGPMSHISSSLIRKIRKRGNA